jgi:hypothetical protein
MSLFSTFFIYTNCYIFLSYSLVANLRESEKVEEIKLKKKMHSE